jgi:peptidoglycan/xylan/chitin deacetylase (PgdA/CDA1 family)
MDASLLVLDALSLSQSTKNSIKKFVGLGGNIFFNFTAGFSDGKGKYIGDSFVNELTALKLSPNKNFVNFKDGLHIMQRVLSVLNNANSGVLLETSIYDLVPVYNTPQSMKPDLFMTNYEVTNPPLDIKKQDSLKLGESGVAWHGYYGKGKWFYLNLPSYIFYESDKNRYDYAQLFNAIVNYLSNDVIIEKFPYIDRQSVVFISEDTEYKFNNFQRFSDLSQKYKVPVTAFIVSSLAEHKDNQDMVKNIANNPYLEFASHSHSHKKIIGTDPVYMKKETSGTKVILDKFASIPIIGFRPPREELDFAMTKFLADSGFSYILGKNEEHLYPRYDEVNRNLLIIPRHGTDDYSYLINLDWDRRQIVDQIIKESKFVTGLDAIYTLSVHTHLFAFNTNIKIIEEFFKYLKQNQQVSVMNGRMIEKRVRQNTNLFLSYQKTGNSIVINIDNKNSEEVKNFHCKVFKNPNLSIKSIKSEDTVGSKHTVNGAEIDINLHSLKPNSMTRVFIELVEK